MDYNTMGNRNLRADVTLGDLAILNQDPYAVLEHFSKTFFLSSNRRLSKIVLDYVSKSITYTYTFGLPDKYNDTIKRHYTFSEKTVWPDSTIEELENCVSRYVKENERFKNFRKNLFKKARKGITSYEECPYHYVRIIRKRGKSDDKITKDKKGV